MKKLLSYVVLIGLLVLVVGCFVGGPGRRGPHDNYDNHGNQHDNGNHNGQQEHHDDHR